MNVGPPKMPYVYVYNKKERFVPVKTHSWKRWFRRLFCRSRAVRKIARQIRRSQCGATITISLTGNPEAGKKIIEEIERELATRGISLRA